MAHAQRTARPVHRASVPVKHGVTRNAHANRAAVKHMSELERECGLTLDEWVAFHAVQKARVLARYGLDRQAVV